MTAEQCSAINATLFRRTPDFDKDIKKDRFPHSYVYSNMYNQETWPTGTGTTHTRDKVFVTRANDDGCWQEVAMGGDGTMTGCDSLCAPTRNVLGWGSDRYTYVRYHRDYQTPPLCYDQLRNVEEVIAQLNAIITGLRKEPDNIVSDFLRLLSIRQSDVIHICGSAGTTVTTTAGMFQANCTKIDLGSSANLPTSKLTMQYLDNHVENLQYQGYFNQEFLPEGTFACTTDLQTHRDLATQNPTLVQMYCLDDFAKGGRYWEYGLMQKRIGNWMFKLDPEPMRFQHIGNGVLQRIWPYQNVAATVGKKPQFDTAYKNAPYQMYHVYNRNARTVMLGDISPVNSEMKFNMARDLMGKWRWMSPDYFRFTDPNNGKTCEYANDKHNYGYLLGEFEMGAVTDYPEIEMIIIAQREPQNVVNNPRCATAPSMVYQTLTPYNSFCSEGE